MSDHHEKNSCPEKKRKYSSKNGEEAKVTRFLKVQELIWKFLDQGAKWVKREKPINVIRSTAHSLKRFAGGCFLREIMTSVPENTYLKSSTVAYTPASITMPPNYLLLHSLDEHKVKVLRKKSKLWRKS